MRQVLEDGKLSLNEKLSLAVQYRFRCYIKGILEITLPLPLFNVAIIKEERRFFVF
ncbi:Conserved hypothetical protein [Clostridium acetobutylicum EA 2018]|uniref:Uncharacterized protein n=1 Tax=Clostridium acetobutylicum (strain ATCC 824 / DSM 792 / JCM 1419 / IAM 19013 / LMG 5710 / NBRC 13948 / NRRL B-527 / VKM B-1787 / 2291 / W) TaxID=272562 RepID=Q97GF0_CLOAB|nr:Hypothetical protein CA_C2417 [Clostridium acetobutylicum ATCC 824]ADZ21469.1 Conserved hypothetical protein [Clostridium acetobutylicum EA 2018]AEI32330.1 hypothetical protein SMB_G2452 [Clostridium acetobutylicum DSM 1731]